MGILNLNLNLTSEQQKELDIEQQNILNNKFENLVCQIKHKIIEAGRNNKLYEREIENFVSYLNGIIRNRMNKGIDELAATENVLLNFNKYLQDFRMTIFRKKQKKENKKPLTEKQKIVNKIMYKIYIFFKEKNLTSEYKKDITQKIKTYFDNSINKEPVNNFVFLFGCI